MFKFIDLQKRCCLTCQYFRGARRVEVIGRQTFIDYDSTMGKCGIFNNVPKQVGDPADMTSFCRYKRWIELPD